MKTTFFHDHFADSLIASLASRYSVGPKQLTNPAPDRAQLESAALLASRAPDHGVLRPFRFVLVGTDKRSHLVELFAADARQRGLETEQIDRARERAMNGPALLAMVVRIRTDVPEVPPHEQWVCAGAGLMNFLNGLHLMGFGAKVLSGPSVRSPQISAAFCEPGESLSAWILTGTPTSIPSPRCSTTPSLLTTWG